ncbi:MAG TPA: NAD(P)H-binding protein [Xanthobacteraceae bacterium]|nr:NAD(P)H-binding protein [Xanthobacteraceae bacterium]
MASIALVGMTGNIGKCILDEALGRGHRVTGTTRGTQPLPAREGLTVATVHPSDSGALAKVLKGHDVAVVSLKWDVNDIDAVIEAIRKSQVPRALIVVGAGSLLRADGRLHFFHMATPSPASKPAMVALERLQKVDDFDWTAISPPTSIKPGQRTGKYRLGTDTMVVDADDNGSISREDFAVAVMDEIERPQHINRRFTVGY